MAPSEDEAPKQEWIVVCVGCLRIKRDGVWSKDRAESLAGASSGYCDRCVKLERKRQSRLND